MILEPTISKSYNCDFLPKEIKNDEEYEYKSCYDIILNMIKLSI